MIEDKFNSDVAKEFLTVLSYCDNEFLKNIPDYILKKINDLAAGSLKEFYIDKNKSLLKQSISDECKDLISIIYLMYMTDSTSKEEILTKWRENENNANN